MLPPAREGRMMISPDHNGNAVGCERLEYRSPQAVVLDMLSAISTLADHTGLCLARLIARGTVYQQRLRLRSLWPTVVAYKVIQRSRV